MGVLAQGTVNFSNGPWEAWADPSTDRLVYIDRVGGTPVNDATWSAQLWINQGGTWSTVGAPANFFGAGLDGIWAGENRSIPVNPGTATQLKVSILNGIGAPLAESAPFTFTQGQSIPPSPADLLMVNFRAFAVPEPSTVALGVLGLGALLLFRRRK
jgi:hypothetical protein